MLDTHLNKNLFSHIQKDNLDWPKKIIGTNIKTCRFCKSQSVTFNNRSHSVPEMLGNKSVFTINECDSCNKKFAKYEAELAKFIPPSFITRIKGKNGFKEVHLKGGNKISGDFEFINIQADLKALNKGLNVVMPRFSRVKVYKALLKCLLSLLPDKELIAFDNIIEWLLSDKGFSSFEYEAKISYGVRLPDIELPQIMSLEVNKQTSNKTSRYIFEGKFNNFILILPFSFSIQEHAVFKTLPARSEREKFYFKTVNLKSYQEQHLYKLKFEL